MAGLIDALLSLSGITRSDLRRGPVNLSLIAKGIVEVLRAGEPERQVELSIEDGLTAMGDRRLLAVMMQNLFENAWKFTKNRERARIEFFREDQEGNSCFCVRDNGAGFDMAFSAKLFGVFQRLHTEKEFEGTGIGLATAERIVRRHGGRIWAIGEVGLGATFCFSLGS
jgi:light-regulated signal transduction histidine kinase (bacteriophytochrome)